MSVDIPPKIIERIREAFKMGRYTLRVHGFERMVERQIHPKDIRSVVLDGEPIEYDPAGTKGTDDSVLFNGFTSDQRPLHVKVAERLSPNGYRHFVITTYEPDPNLWQDNFSKRRQS